MTKKTFIIDTSVLIHDPDALNSFVDNTVILAWHVLEELENLRKYRDEASKNAVLALANINSIKEEYNWNCKDSVTLSNNTILKVDGFPDSNNPRSSLFDVIRSLSFEYDNIVFVTKNLLLKIKVESAGIQVQDYVKQKFSYKNLYSGLREIEVKKLFIDTFYKDGVIKNDFGLEFAANEYCVLKSGDTSKSLGKYNIRTNTINALPIRQNLIWGISPLNIEQKCAIDLLLRDDISLVTLIGQAGSGKTLLALAAGLHKVFDEKMYSRILVSRPIMPLGKDIGFLPGMKEDKLMHWMQPIYDNLEFLCSLNGFGDASEAVKSLTESKKVEMEAVTYIRGRSLPKMFIIIDEAQNLTPHEIKTVISRAGHGTKIIITGDPTQIDSPYLDENSNGLTYIVSKFQQLPLYGHILMNRTERSALAAAAAELL